MCVRERKKIFVCARVVCLTCFGILQVLTKLGGLDNVDFRDLYDKAEIEIKFDHRCTRFENPGGGSGRFLPNFGREGI
jgi:hypothetical protein